MITKLATILAIFLMCMTGCSAQTLNCKQKEVQESIWVPKSDAYSKVAFDSSLTLVFQKYFNDSIDVYVEDSLLFDGYYETNPVTVVVPKFNKIKGELYGVDKIVRIHLLKKNECIQFKIKSGFRYVYITREKDGKWFVEHSIFKRKYY